MTQGAGQGPGTWQESGTAADEPGATGAPSHSVRPAQPIQHARPAPTARPAPAGQQPPPAGHSHAHAPQTAFGHSSLEQAAPHPEHTMSAPAPEEDEAGEGHDGHDEGYTPTERDLPVVSVPEEEGHERTLVDVAAQTAAEEGDGPLYVVGDVHGYLDELRAALREAGIIDEQDDWIADNARLWFLGDFTDRGPDGIGVIDLVMNLSAQAAAAGGYCKALMGNHELLLFGAKKFGDTPVNSSAGTASFQAAWLLNGGQRTDMERLEDHHVQWMSRLDAMALADGHLLLHSDATCYLDYGTTIEAVNDAVTEALQRNDADETWDLFRKFTKRFAFRDETGSLAARELLTVFGGRQIVHGHSPIPYLLGELVTNGDAGEDGDADEDAVPEITGPHLYADGLALAMDGGVTMDGKLLVTQLPLER